jgi:hypothetical protein
MYILQDQTKVILVSELFWAIPPDEVFLFYHGQISFFVKAHYLEDACKLLITSEDTCKWSPRMK